jgi:hypothetical protein
LSIIRSSTEPSLSPAGLNTFVPSTLSDEMMSVLVTVDDFI